MNRGRQSLRERFEKKINRTAECWLWIGCLRKGYGQINEDHSGKRKLVASRVSYEMYVGAIPIGQCVLHRCDNAQCVNPQHLFLGSPADNSEDMVKKGRAAPQKGENNGNAKLTWEQICKIRDDNRPQERIANDYGIWQTHVGKIKRGEIWRHKN